MKKYCSIKKTSKQGIKDKNKRFKKNDSSSWNPPFLKNNIYSNESEASSLKRNKNFDETRELVAIGYARVSTISKVDALKKQEDALNDYLRKNYYSYTIVKDIGSGVNNNNPGLLEIITKIYLKQINVLVVTSLDRLSRFSCELIQFYAKLSNVKIVSLKKFSKVNKEELLDDLSSEIIKISKDLLSFEGKKYVIVDDGSNKNKQY